MENSVVGFFIINVYIFTGRLPLYVKHVPVHHTENKKTEVVGGTSYTLLVPTPTRTLRYTR